MQETNVDPTHNTYLHNKTAYVREAIEAKIAEDAAAPRRRPANLIEALGDSVGSVASGKRDLARNKQHLQGYGR